VFVIGNHFEVLSNICSSLFGLVVSDEDEKACITLTAARVMTTSPAATDKTCQTAATETSSKSPPAPKSGKPKAKRAGKNDASAPVTVPASAPPATSSTAADFSDVIEIFEPKARAILKKHAPGK